MDAIPNRGTFKVNFKTTRATVLGRESDGNPAFTVANYGRGQVYFLAVPLELNQTQTPGAFHDESAAACWRLYQFMARKFVAGRAVRKSHPLVGLTEHVRDAATRIAVVVNYSPQPIRERLTLAPGWRLHRVLHGQAGRNGPAITVNLGKNDGCVLSLHKK